MAHDVFISYASGDKLTADAACNVLEAQGIRCWIAPRDILPSTSYAEGILKAISEAKILLLVFSSHANASNQVSKEVERAVHREIPILPLRIEGVAPARSLEYFISESHWLDAITPPMQRHLEHLVDVIKRILAEGGADTPVPPPVKSSFWSGQRVAIGLSALAIVVAGAVFATWLLRNPAPAPSQSLPASNPVAASSSPPAPAKPIPSTAIAEAPLSKAVAPVPPSPVVRTREPANPAQPLKKPAEGWWSITVQCEGHSVQEPAAQFKNGYYTRNFGAGITTLKMTFISASKVHLTGTVLFSSVNSLENVDGYASGGDDSFHGTASLANSADCPLSVVGIPPQ